MLYDTNRPFEGDYPSPEIIRGNILEVSVRAFDNQIICKVIDMKGNMYNNVQTINPNIGHDTNYVKPSYKIGGEVYLLKTTANAPIYIIGSVFTPSHNLVSNTVVIPSLVEDDNAIATSDYVIENSGNRINLTSHERGIVCTTNKDFRVQLQNGGIFRISHLGNADDFAINGTQFLEVLSQYQNEVNEKLKQIEETNAKVNQLMVDLQTAITAVSAYASAQVTATTTLPVFSPLLPGYTALNTALASSLTTIATDIAALNTETSTYENLALKEYEDFKVDTINTLNSRVRFPSD